MLGHVAKRRVGRYDHVLFHTLPSLSRKFCRLMSRCAVAYASFGALSLLGQLFSAPSTK